MALLGLIRVPGEIAVAEVREWMGKEYLVATAATAGAVFGEEILNNVIRSVLGLTGTADIVAKNLFRLAMSGALYYLFLRFDRDVEAVASSIGLAALAATDIIKELTKITPEKAALSLLGKARTARALARVSATARIVRVEQVTQERAKAGGGLESLVL